MQPDEIKFRLKETVKIEKFEGSLKHDGQDRPFETLVFEDGELISKETTKE